MVKALLTFRVTPTNIIYAIVYSTWLQKTGYTILGWRNDYTQTKLNTD